MGENFPAHENSKKADTNTSHVWRYYLARGFIEPGDVVNDISCGYGYGSRILSRSKASAVIGYDVDQDALKEARKNYPDLEFYYIDLDKNHYPLPEADVTISIETIEHLDDPEAFARQIKLSTRRYILITTPIVPTTQAALGVEKGSPYHHHDFSIVSLNNLFIDKKWRNVGDAILGQNGLVVYAKS